MKKRFILTAVASMAMVAGLASCGEATVTSEPADSQSTSQGGSASVNVPSEITVNIKNEDTSKEVKKPKYVFMFIGDGMSYPQIQSASYYLGATESKIDNGNKTTGTAIKGGKDLSFMNFEHSGSAKTYDATSFAPDSASTATSLATGKKTWSGSINVSTDFTKKYETIAEQLKDDNFKVGIVTSVNLNHATPAAYYAHQQSRNSYYDIAKELVSSDFDYFAGGDFLKPTGSSGSEKSIYDIATEAGYKVVKSQNEAYSLSKDDGKVIVIDEHLADSNSMLYDMDRTAGQWALADYVDKGIELLDNDNGFFMMVEGGKIDWACHANDAMATITDTIALSNAVDEAIEFYNEHPDETLILVTGDHETGGLTIGYAGTNYDLYFNNLSNQKISFAKFNEKYVANYKANNTSFDDVLEDVQTMFGLVAPQNEATKTGNQLVLTDYEYQKLDEAYKQTMKTSTSSISSQEKGILYGSYEPLTVTITHILNNKSGISFTSYSHTGLPTAVFAQGAGAELFDGYYDNTDIYNKLAELLDL